MPTSDEIRNWATAYAAIVATAAFAWNVLAYFLNRPSVIIDPVYNRLGMARKIGKDAIEVSLTNPGPRNITIIALGFKNRGKKGYTMFAGDAYVTNFELPVTLSESERYVVYAEIRYLPPLENIECFVAKDSTGKIHVARKTVVEGK